MKGAAFRSAVGICAVALAAWTQEVTPEKKLTAREMFYAARDAAKPAPPEPAPRRTRPKPEAQARRSRTQTRVSTDESAGTVLAKAPAETNPNVMRVAYTGVPLGLRYTILKREGSQATDVAPDTVFHSGDRIRLSIEANDNGYLYIIHQGSSGTWKALFPSPEVADGNNQVQRARTYVVPPGSVFSFVGEPGIERLFVVLSRQPEPELDRLIYSLQGKQPTAAPEPRQTAAPQVMMAQNLAIGDDVVGRLRNVYSRDLIIEKVNDDEPGQQRDKSVYVVNPAGSNDARVVADIALKHE